MEKQKINIARFKAAIFDMDGTMVDNMSAHKEAWVEFCKRHNIELTDDNFKQKISGFKNDQIFRNLFGENISQEQILTFGEEKESTYRELYRPKLKEVSGLTQIIKDIQSYGLKLAIATTAPEKNRNLVLTELKLENYFEVILGEEDVTKGKPDPEIYLKTAEMLNVNPDECIVFEDSRAGLQAGKGAGMTVVGITTSHSKEDLASADIIVQDYTEISLD